MLRDCIAKSWSADDTEYYINGLRRQIVSADRLYDYKEGKLSDEEMADKYGNDWKRILGIDIACYDEQNEALPYPIKITHNENAIYENCDPSLSDPNQGWEMEDDYDDEEEEWF